MSPFILDVDSLQYCHSRVRQLSKHSVMGHGFYKYLSSVKITTSNEFLYERFSTRMTFFFLIIFFLIIFI